VTGKIVVFWTGKFVGFGLESKYIHSFHHALHTHQTRTSILESTNHFWLQTNFIDIELHLYIFIELIQ